MADDFPRWLRYAKAVPGRLFRGLQRAVLYVEGVIEDEAPVDSSSLVNSISSYAVNQGSHSYGMVVIGAQHARYVIEGTGIYGPKGQPIYPRSKKALAFSVGGASVVVRSVKGQRPNPFQERGFERARPGAIKIIKDAFR